MKPRAVSHALPAPYFTDGLVTIYHGDCRDILPALAPAVLVTDPPYGIAWSTGQNKSAGRTSRAHAGILNDENTAARDAVLAMLPGVPGLVFGSFYAPFPATLKQVLVWAKPADAGLFGSVTGFRRDAEPIFVVGPWPPATVQWSSVLAPGSTCIGSYAKAVGHPHAKPLGLMRDLIAKCPPGLIVDPFMGSGSTLRAAMDLGRAAVGIELDEAYCEIAARRLGQQVMF